MKSIIKYIRNYLSASDKRLLLIISVFTAALIFCNYHFHIDDNIRKINSFSIKLLCWTLVFSIAFGIPYWVTHVLVKPKHRYPLSFFILLFIAPVLFAIKLSLNISFKFSPQPEWNSYWNHVIYWPLLLLIIGGSVFIIWRLFDKDQPLYGMRVKGVDWKPYLLMLLLMVPLIALASTQPDFQAVYPKLRSVTGLNDTNSISLWQKLLYEITYGSDFISIEFFFRGFLILAFVRWVGRDAVLPMACFYCTIHFGKPLGECISSYFGGLLLGIVVYNTRSILGGLLVHLGIAWMMELAGYITPLYQ